MTLVLTIRLTARHMAPMPILMGHTDRTSMGRRFIPDQPWSSDLAFAAEAATGVIMTIEATVTVATAAGETAIVAMATGTVTTKDVEAAQ
jgi:hypothetical protein